MSNIPEDWKDVRPLERPRRTGGSRIPDEFGEKTSLPELIGKRGERLVCVRDYIDMGENDEGRELVAISVELRDGSRKWFFTSSKTLINIVKEFKLPFIARLVSRGSQKRKGATYYAFEPPEDI